MAAVPMMQSGRAAWIVDGGAEQPMAEPGDRQCRCSASCEIRLRTMGVRRISALLPAACDRDRRPAQLRLHRAHRRRATSRRSTMSASADAGLLASLGGTSHAGWALAARWPAWKRRSKSSSGRIVLPLVEPSTAAQYGVSPPKAVILFGPPEPGRQASPRRWLVGSVAVRRPVPSRLARRAGEQCRHQRRSAPLADV